MHQPESDDSQSSTSDINAAFRASIAAFALASSPRKSHVPKSEDGPEIRPRRKRIPKLADRREARGQKDGSESSAADSSSRSHRPKKKRRVRGYAAPEVYEHLDGLPDILTDGLDVVFCGINPGQRSAEIGHHFAHHTNHFWFCLHESGFTPNSESLRPEEDLTIPERFSLGLTNLVGRVTAEQRELSIAEQANGISALLQKVARYRPRVLCFIGLGIAKTFLKQQNLCPNTDGTTIKLGVLTAGIQGYKMVHSNSDEGAKDVKETIFYALPSTSARVIVPQRSGKVLLFAELKRFVDRLKAGDEATDKMHIIASQF